MAAPPQDLSRLTRSSRSAIAWAAQRASDRASSGASNIAQQAYGPPAQVTVADLLTGIMLAHPGTSEPAELLRYAGIPEERLFGILEPTGFTPAGRFEVAPSAPEFLDMDPDADSAFRTAHELSERVNPETDRLVRLRDLFGGILVGSSEGPAILDAAMRGGSLALSSVVSVYAEFLALDSGSSRFGEFLSERFPFGEDGQAPPPAVATRRVAVLDADRPGTEDWVDIGAEVDAFAYLIAAPALHPPLAIGLFGDWGSGKSFFMEELRRRVGNLTTAARASARTQKDLPVYRHIAQIEFNAWHYVEGNLWASLVEHIFQTLAGRSPDAEVPLEDRLREWTLELESQQVAKADVDQRLEQLRAEQQERSRTLESTRWIRRAKLEALQETRARDVLEAVTLQPEVRERIDRLLADVGLVSANASALEAREALDDAKGVLQRGNALLTPLRQRGRSGWLWAFALVAVALSGPLVAWGLAWLPTRFPALADLSLDGVTRTFTGIAAFLSAAAIVLRRGSDWLSSSLNRVEEANARLEEIRAERAREAAREEAALQDQLHALDSELARLEGRKAELDARIATLHAELRSITPARVLSDFIEDRVGSEDYRKHLGIPALIRRDFRKLSTFIERQNKALLAGTEPADNSGPAVNRVILYIDDLDRCPPQRVVEVLQAVHLLLAFELFVVVVAVDSRWLSRSLLTHYDELLGLHSSNGGRDLDRATPDNYLEKIFQIPFHVRPLTDDAQRKVLLGLLGAPKDQRAGGESDAARDTAGGGRWEGGDEEREGGAGRGQEDDGERDRSTETESTDGAKSASVTDLDVLMPDLTVDRMSIRPGELKFMGDLRPLLGRTPRAMKRFVNVYRLLTAISEAGDAPFYIDNDELASQGPDADPPPYQIAMLLLAIVTGLPDIAPDILRPIEAGVAAVERGDRTRDEIHLGWVLQRYAAGGLVLRPDGPSPEYRRLKGWLDTYQEGRWARIPLDLVAPWIDVVSRFSFRSEIGIDA